MIFSLERARSWNLSAPQNIGARPPAPLSLCKFQIVFSRGATFMPSRKRSVVPFNLTCSTRVRARITNSTVRYHCLCILQDFDVHDAAKTLDQGIPASTSAFAARFESIFPIPQNNHTTEKFSQDITSNLLGGIGYFYGSSIEDHGFSYEWDEDDGDLNNKPKGPRLSEPRELLTATPSRSFFPRGFYWYVR